MYTDHLTRPGTRAVIDAVFGRQSEQDLAAELVGSLSEGMLLIADRNFAGYPLWTAVRTQGAQLLWRLGAHRVFPIHHRLSDGSWRSQFQPPAADRAQGAQPIPVRVVRYRVRIDTIDRTGRRGARNETIRLLTSILDPTHAHARDLAACYRQRWECENGYQELKTWLRGPDVVLRSQHPDDLRQELWAHLIVYQTLRHLVIDTAEQYRLDPDTLPFLTCLRSARTAIINLAIVAGHTLTDALTRLADHLLDDQYQRRTNRTSDRVAKRPHRPYKSKKPDMTSTTATYTINICQPKAKESP